MSKLTAGSPQFAADDVLDPQLQKTSQRYLEELSARKQNWAATSCRERIELLDALRDSLAECADDWVAACCAAKGLAKGTRICGEEWLNGPCLVARNIRLLGDSIASIARDGRPRLPGRLRVRASGQIAVPVFPTGLFDNLLFNGYSAEIWMQQDVTLENVLQTMAVAYREAPQGNLALVLGAGNVSSIGPMDLLYKLFVENQVVLLKMNPVNDYLTEIFAKAFKPLSDRQLLRIVKGGAAIGRFLCNHELVDSIHITGSDKTHDAIVYGVGDEGQRRKAARDPVNSKLITSELGNISPVIVVPGKWSDADLAFQAENVASMLVNNAGFNCNAVRVLVTDQGWPQRELFLTAIEQALAKIPLRRAYYPGAHDRYRAFVEHRSDERDGVPPSAEEIPWTMVRNLDPLDHDEICFTAEAFCGVMGEVSLASDSVANYLDQAAEFANDRLWGSLNATILVHPKSLRDHSARQAFDRVVDRLRYGTVAINHWAALNYGLVSTTWGAYPGHPPHDIQSGSGVVHNTYMFDKPEKTVMRGPFRPFPKPVWFATHRRTHRLGPALFRFEQQPSWWKLPSVALQAIG